MFQAERIYVKHLRQELDGLVLRPQDRCGWSLESQDGVMRLQGLGSSFVTLYRPSRDCHLFPVVTRRLLQGVRQRCEVVEGKKGL